MRSYAALYLILSACGSAYADRVPIGVAPAPQGSFRVDLVNEYGQSLQTYRHRGRFYVLGEEGQRYSVRVQNPTGERVEAVISIDGLDSVDGRTADFVNKRGYVIQPYGTLQVDGFRVSMDDVATFRFSSVPNSYAGRKGKARHVGVVGVAIFREQRQEPVYIPSPVYPTDDYEVERSPGASRRSDSSPAGKAAPRTASPAPTAAEEAPSGGGHGRAAQAPRSAPCYNCGQDENTPYRPGLGTEFGERRSSRVSYVPFIRANATRPYALVEIRYNDRDGLVALGIPIYRPPHVNDLHLRETANPFPHSSYSAPPPGWE